MSDDEHNVELVREDEQALFRQGMKQMFANAEEKRRMSAERRAIAERNATYGIGDRLYFIVERLPSKEGQPDRWKGECIAGLPRADLAHVVHGTDVEDVMFEARHAYLQLLVRSNVERESTKASDRACQASFEIAEIRGLS